MVLGNSPNDNESPNRVTLFVNLRRRRCRCRRRWIKLAELMKSIVEDNLMKVGCHKIRRWPFTEYHVCSR